VRWEGCSPAPSPLRLLLAVADPALLLQLSAWLPEEGYAALPAFSPEEARAVLDHSACAGILLELWSGMEAPRWKAFVRWQRTNSPALPIGVITSRERAREAEWAPEGAFVVSTPLYADHLFLELARALHRPLSGEHVRQAKVVAALLAAVRANNHQQLRRLCTPTVTSYPSGLARTSFVQTQTRKTYP
jgi:DNA-binding NtrC family response regulator